LLGANVGVGASNFAFHAVVSRLLGAASYGAVGALLNIVFVLAVPLGALSLVVAQAVSEADADEDVIPLTRWTRNAAAAAVVAVGGLAGLSPLISDFLHLRSPVPLIILTVWLLPALVGSVLQGVLIGRTRFGGLAITILGGTGLVRLAAGVLLVKAGLGVDGAVTATVAGQIASALVATALLHNELRRSPRDSGRKLRGREAVLNVSAVGGFWVLGGMDTFLGRHFLAPSAAGWYAAASTAASMALFLPGPVSLVAFPRFVASKGVGDDAKRALAEALGIVGTIGFATAATMMLLPRLIITVLFGHGYGPSVGVVGTLGVASSVMGMISVLTYFHLARRSVASQLSWLGVAVAAVLIAFFHSRPEAIALCMVATCAATAVALIASWLPSAGLWRTVRPEGRVVAARPLIPTGTATADPADDPAEPGSGDHGDRQRILIFNWRDICHPLAGGAEVYTHRVARAWADAGHEVTLFCSRVAGRPETEDVDGIHVIRRGSRHTVYGAGRRYYLEEGRGNFDLVVDEINTRPFRSPKFVHDARVVALIHQVAREVWHYEALFPISVIGRYVLEPRWLRLYRDVPVVTVSESSRESLEAYGLRRVTVIPEGCATPRSIDPVTRDEKPTIAFVGRLAWNKRPMHAIRALKHLQQSMPDAQLVVIGSGPLHARLRRNAPLGVTFLGRTTEEEKYAVMARVHSVVVTSVREGWGLVVSEAASVRTPTVGYDVPGLRDSVRLAGGVAVRPNPRALAAALARHLPVWAAEGWQPPPTSGLISWAQVGERILGVSSAHVGESAVEEPGSIADAPELVQSLLDDTGGRVRRNARLAGAARAVSIVSGAVGVIMLSLLGLFVGSGGDTEAAVGCGALVISTASAAIELTTRRTTRGALATSGRTARSNRSAEHVAQPVRDRVMTRAGLVAVVAVAIAAARSWFTRATSLAGGDLSPPDGLAWISHMFAPWRWSGSDLGRPGINQLALPWGAFLEVVHAVGGSPAVAQRLWCTALFAVAAGACYGLMQIAGIRNGGAVIGALSYCFNPFVMTSVAPSPLYLVALALIPVVALIVVAVGRGRLTPRAGALLLASTAPFIGYAFLNPPLAVMIAATVAGAPFAVLAIWGREAGWRSFRTVAAGIPLLALLSLYWVVPALISVSGAATGRLSSLTDWTWTESRSGLANAFWLNTSWAFGSTSYFGFAARYARFPLTVVRYIAPAAAFAALPLVQRREVNPDQRRTAILAGGVALFFVVLATGTLWPGRLIFNPLYRLPLGWLVREPGRLLLFSGLGYALLVGVTTDVLAHMLGGRLTRERRRSLRALLNSSRLSRGLLASGLLGAVLFTNAPLAFGEVVGKAGKTFDVAHVAVPRYWSSMATFVNVMHNGGNLLVLPPDDFYQMPYTWGYYGADGFILDMIERNVLDPSLQGYWAGQDELVHAVDLIAEAALASNWNLVDNLLGAIDTRYVLLRGDIDSGLPGRAIVSPAALDAALRRDPHLSVVHTDGPLDLFAQRQIPSGPPGYVTVSSAEPDLADLAALPPATALITSPMRPGVPALLEEPADQWRVNGGVASLSFLERAGWTYAAKASTPDGLGTTPGVTVAEARGPNGRRLVVSVPIGNSGLPNGDFRQGLWEATVGDCNGHSARALTQMSAGVQDNGGPADSSYLRLSASVDTACESQRLGWTSGRVLLTLGARHDVGQAPRACLYAIGPDTCLPLPPIPSTATWSTYRAIVTPSPQTTGLVLFLYSDAPGGGRASVNDYANAATYTLPTSPVVLATPTSVPAQPLRLVVTDSSYSTHWSGPANGVHVLVDGVKNGWLSPAGASGGPPHYDERNLVALAARVSFVAAIAVLLGLLGFGSAAVVRHRPSDGAAGGG